MRDIRHLIYEPTKYLFTSQGENLLDFWNFAHGVFREYRIAEFL